MCPAVAEVVFVLKRGRGRFGVKQVGKYDAGGRLGVQILHPVAGTNDHARLSGGVHTPDGVEMAVLPAEGGLDGEVELGNGQRRGHPQPAPDQRLGVLDADPEVEGRDCTG